MSQPVVEIDADDLAVFRAGALWIVGIIQSVATFTDTMRLPMLTVDLGDLGTREMEAARDGSVYICRKVDYRPELGQLIGGQFSDFAQLAQRVRACRK